MSEFVHVALDAMGGDNAPAEIVKGTVEALQSCPNLKVTLAGREDQVLKKVASLYEEQAENEIGRTVSIIEPTLVALLSIVIGGVLLSVMLPMAGILSTL